MKGIKTILANGLVLKRVGTVTKIASKGCTFIIPLLEIASVSKLILDTMDDLKTRCNVVTYNDAVNAVLDADMYSDDKVEILVALKENDKPEIYQAVINTVNSVMCSEDKVKIILNMCEEENYK